MVSFFIFILFAEFNLYGFTSLFIHSTSEVSLVISFVFLTLLQDACSFNNKRQFATKTVDFYCRRYVSSNTMIYPVITCSEERLHQKVDVKDWIILSQSEVSLTFGNIF